MTTFENCWNYIMVGFDFYCAYWFFNFLWQLLYDPNFVYNPKFVGTAFFTSASFFAILGIKDLTKIIKNGF